MLYAILKVLIAGISRVLFRLSVVGADRVPREGRLLLASNHLSVLDPALIGAVLPRELDYMAKTELFRIPGFGALIRRLNAHPVDRSGSDSAALRLALRLLGDGRAVLVFPEGTRGSEGHLQAARAGAGMLAALSGAPVVPVYVHVMPGRSGYPQYGGVSIACAQCVFSGLKPTVRQSSRTAWLNDPGRTARLKASTVASSLSGDRFSCVASSLMELAAFGGNTDGMNRPTALASTIENAIWSGCRATSVPQMA